MAEIIKETVTDNTVETNAVLKNPATTDNNPVMATQIKTAATPSQRLEYLINFMFGLLEVLLAIRLIFRLAGASTASGFVSFIYAITGIFVAPFDGIFSRSTAPGLETTSVLEPATVVALIVYALVAWGMVELIHILSGEKQPK